MSAAELLIPEPSEMPQLEPATATWLRADWAPRFGSFLRTLRPARIADGSPEEAHALGQLIEITGELASRLGPVLSVWLRGAATRGLAQITFSDKPGVQMERKLALRFLDSAIEKFGDFVEILAGVYANFPAVAMAEAVRELHAHPEILSQLDTAQRAILRSELDVLVGFESLDGDAADLAYWSRQALESTRKLSALQASPEFFHAIRGELARIRARYAWSDWDAEEIRREFEPWPTPSGS